MNQRSGTAQPSDNERNLSALQITEAEAKAQQIQRGFEPAETIPQLVDAVRQDTAGIGACVSSIRFLADTRGDVPKPVIEWVDRLAFHLEQMEAKCALAVKS